MSDDELTELALAADPDEPLGEDAVSMFDYLSDEAGEEPTGELLPTWYMPSSTRRTRRGWRTGIILVVILAFVVIEAAGLCSTYGQVVFA